jgi:hypothetical protein
MKHSTVGLGLAMLVFAQAGLWGDTITLASGAKVEGTIKSMVAGQVTLDTSAGQETVALGDVKEIVFDTPHLTESVAGVPIEHFLKDFDAQELVRNSQALTKARKQLREKLDQIQRTWGARKSIERVEEPKWERTKEDFLAVLLRYKEILRDLDYHLFAQVQAYNRLASEARGIYVGVKGLGLGSALIPQEAQELDPKTLLPQGWYERLYYEAYLEGFDAAKNFERLTPR